MARPLPAAGKVAPARARPCSRAPPSASRAPAGVTFATSQVFCPMRPSVSSRNTRSPPREVVCPARGATNVLGVMPIPPYEGRRTYFFFADVEPKELMTFGVESGIQLDDDSNAQSPRACSCLLGNRGGAGRVDAARVRPGRPRRDPRDIRARPPRAWREARRAPAARGASLVARSPWRRGSLERRRNDPRAL